jgi:trehalose 6-phosphate synthase/phosphatase
MRDKERTIRLRLMTGRIEQTMDEEYRAASRRLILLDYDGTLVGFTNKPGAARPDPDLQGLLGSLTADAGNEVVIISGRGRITMEQWLGRLDLSLISDHGAWVRERQGAWKAPMSLPDKWKDSVRPLLERYVDRTPGALIEDKEYSLVWHYRAADPYIGPLRARELRDALQDLTGDAGLGILEGNKVVEVKNADANKGRAASLWLEREDWDFILAIGDDRTDEDVFAALPQSACSVRVGWAPSRAEYYADSVADVRRLLTRLRGDIDARP